MLYDIDIYYMIYLKNLKKHYMEFLLLGDIQIRYYVVASNM